MNYADLFHHLHPNFFQREGIRSMPGDWVFTELVMDLRESSPDTPPNPAPANITFAEYHGDMAALRDAVRQVDEDWVQYFHEGGRYYCAYDRGRVVAFCDIGEMGQCAGLRISGPGCVGTIPAYRKQGIGLELVRLATETLRQDGYDLSWIHYTHLAPWYMKLGYQPVLRWNSSGLLP